MYIDTDKPADQPKRKPLVAGIDLWHVAKAEQAKSAKSGANMLKIELVRVSQMREQYPDRIYEIVMLEGPGWAIGKEKLVAFMGGPVKGEFEPLDLLDKRVWLSTGTETYKTVDKKTGEMVEREKLRVLVTDPKQSGAFHWCGIQHEKNVPAGCALPGEDTPF